MCVVCYPLLSLPHFCNALPDTLPLSFQTHFRSIYFLFLCFSPKFFELILYIANVSLGIGFNIFTYAILFANTGTPHQIQPQGCSKISHSFPKALCCQLYFSQSTRLLPSTYFKL